MKQKADSPAKWAENCKSTEIHIRKGEILFSMDKTYMAPERSSSDTVACLATQAALASSTKAKAEKIRAQGERVSFRGDHCPTRKAYERFCRKMIEEGGKALGLDGEASERVFLDSGFSKNECLRFLQLLRERHEAARNGKPASEPEAGRIVAKARAFSQKN